MRHPSIRNCEFADLCIGTEDRINKGRSIMTTTNSLTKENQMMPSVGNATTQKSLDIFCLLCYDCGKLIHADKKEKCRKESEKENKESSQSAASECSERGPPNT